MKQLMRSSFAFVAIASAVALAAAVFSAQTGHADSSEKTKARVGKPAPDFTLTDQNGEERSLSDYKGKVVVLEWTNPGCPFVKRHYRAGTMVKLEEKFGEGKESNLVWLRINSTNKNHPDHLTAEETRAWAKKVGVSGPILDDSDGRVGQMYGARTTPHMYVINSKGVLVYSGAIDDNPRFSKKPEHTVNYIENILTGYANHRTVEPYANDPYGCSVKYAK